MDKSTRLGGALNEIRERLRTIMLLDRIAELEGRMDPAERSRRASERAELLSFVERIDLAGFLQDEDLARVDTLRSLRYTDENGTEHPLLTEKELDCLRIRKGTLTDEERGVMQSHVVVTGRILSQVRFPKIYAQVPEWAASHHELLNGKGYPNRLTAADIPREVRLLTILDIFEALTAKDRPYKKGVPLEKALGILHSMAEQEGSIDKEILALFEASKAWEGAL